MSPAKTPPPPDIQIISASAGSGKTYTLSEELKKAVTAEERENAARPEAVLATTFTRKASAELRERVRRHLLEAGKAEEAVRLNAARMGTVNSVCGRIVSDFAFSLGLPPDIRVLDEDLAAAALRKSLSTVIGGDSADEIARIKSAFYEWDVEKAITTVVDLARANNIDPPTLVLSRNRCLLEISTHLGPPMDEAAAAKLEKDLILAIEAFEAAAVKAGDETAATKKAVDRARRFLLDLRNNKAPRWQDWNALAGLDPGKKSAEAASRVSALARLHHDHPRFRDDLAAAVRLVFDTAVQALEAYSAYKQDRGFIDFVDQERLALELLDDPAVREYFRDGLDLVLVDEFQDTSPIQLAIFLRLAAIAHKSVWVGDQKQSIYGFRGSDPELMDGAIYEILKGGRPRTLEYSYRSRPELVRLTSDLFARAFRRHGFPEERVVLKPILTDEKEPKDLGPVVERWIPEVKGRTNADKRASALAAAVKECLNDPSVRVRDLISGESRPVRPGDIAVLCRQNKTADLISAKLAGIGIRAAQVRPGLLQTPEARLVLSALRLWVDPSDALAAAEIARILDHPDDPDFWLAALLEHPGLEAFRDHPAVSAVRESGAAERSALGVLAAFDRVLDLIGARDICRRWTEPSRRLSNLDSLRALARRYAGQSSDAGTGMTPAGLLAFLSDLDDGESDPQAYNPDDGAVVVGTWHKAKGLEWPIVVLYELESDFSRVSFAPRIASDKSRIELSDPLAGRWIRYWPNPYTFNTKKAPYLEAMAAHPAVSACLEVEKRESLRLLYVGWTRARDRVVLACQKKKFDCGMFVEFSDDDGPLLSEPDNGPTVWAGSPVSVRVRKTEAVAPILCRPASVPTFAVSGPREHPPAYGWPEEAGRIWKAGKPEILGSCIFRRCRPDDPTEAGQESERSDGGHQSCTLVAGLGQGFRLFPH